MNLLNAVKNTVVVVFASCSACAFAGIQDKLIRFSSPGPDCYADGTVVRDGECYALVWSPAGASFSGFNADGTPVSANDRMVLAAPLALAGKCRDAVFQIPAKEYEMLKDGTWAVCLVDTRTIAGAPAGVEAGKPLRVNRWGIVSSGVEIVDAGSTKLCRASAGARSAASSPGVRANMLSAVPGNLLPPQIAAVEVANGAVALSVKNTVPYLTYTISSSDVLAHDGFAPDKYADRLDGAADAGAEIVLETDAKGTSRFFKITRVE